MLETIDATAASQLIAVRASEGLSCQSIFDELRRAAARIEDQLTYVFATGSSECCVRDALAYQLHTTHRNIAREYWVKCNGQRRRADIAVLGEDGPAPTAIIELKQLYLKDFFAVGSRAPHANDDIRHKYICNIVNDVTDRRSACTEVYGVIFMRRIPPGGRLPCVNNCAHVYVEEDAPFVAGGIERMHRSVAALSCAADYYPKAWEQARLLLQQKAPQAGVELFGWVIRAR